MISTTDLNILLGEMTLAIATNQAVDLLRYNQDVSNELFELNCMLMDYEVLYAWNQHSNGTTDGLTNYITQEQFDKLVSVVRKYV